MLKIHFMYDLDKDVDNFLRGTKSVNNSTPTKLQELYVEKYSNTYNRETVTKFLKVYSKEKLFDFLELVAVIERNWHLIEESFISKTEKLFRLTYPTESITAYLSTNSRCTYSIQDNYFFVFMSEKSSNTYIMHELFHFYTWYAFHDELIEQGVSEKRYNNIKESLTELLNIEYTDLMAGATDTGYPQHIEMRNKVRESWLLTKDLRRTVSVIASI